MTSARWWNKKSPVYVPVNNNNLTAIQRKKCIYGSVESKVGDCKAQVEPKNGNPPPGD